MGKSGRLKSIREAKHMGRVRGWLKLIKSQAAHKALLAGLIIPFVLVGANPMTAQAPPPDCMGSRISISALERDPPRPFSLLIDPKSPLDAGLYCLADHNERSQDQRIFQVSHTLWDLVQFEERAHGEELSQGRDFRLKLSEGIEVLALHFDPRATLVKMLLDSQDLPYPQALLEAPDSQEELIIQFGGVASLAAKLDFMASLMQYLVHSLTSSEIPLPPSEDEVTLVFNLKGGKAALDIAAVLRGSTLLSDPDLAVQNQLDISQITVTIGNGTITGETQLDPADLTITRGQLEVKFQIGPNSITSTTVFAKGEGLKKEILVVTAKLGALNLTGQATFGAELQEFKLEASLAGLVFSTLLTPEGLSQPTFGFELHF